MNAPEPRCEAMLLHAAEDVFADDTWKGSLLESVAGLQLAAKLFDSIRSCFEAARRPRQTQFWPEGKHDL